MEIMSGPYWPSHNFPAMTMTVSLPAYFNLDPVAGATQLYVSQHTPSHKHLAWQRSWADLLWILWMEHIMHSFDLCRHWLLESSCTPLNLPVDKIVEIAEVCQKVAQRHENTHTSCPTIWSLHSFKLVGLHCPFPQEWQVCRA